MGAQKIALKIAVGFNDLELIAKIAKELNIKEFTYRIESKSLDARNKRNIHWVMQIVVTSPEIKDEAAPYAPELNLTKQLTHKKVVVIGCGPAGFFAALVLLRTGAEVTIIERGAEVGKRSQRIDAFEKSGNFDELGNYAFGEGGAGTFSDGKLTSRSKHISAERTFILNQYVTAGAPDEILYMTHPHLGSDNLKIIVKNLRQTFLNEGGQILFETMFDGFYAKNGVVSGVKSSAGDFETDFLLVATGHSAYETYRMLIENSVPFRTKNFALGFRAEHEQAVINRSQWGCETLAGVKAAEYRLTSQANNNHSVYTFCMCPGGIVVPATAYSDANIVNGMSLYHRDGAFANAACVAGVHPDALLGHSATATETLDYLEKLEQKFFAFSNNYSAPSCSIAQFIQKKKPTITKSSSYPLGLAEAPLYNMLPTPIIEAIGSGLKDFCNKIKGYDTGILLGLESKTSAPIQAIRDEDFASVGFKNLYIIGEGSGLAGGIISSAADGVKVALSIAERNR